MADKRRELMKSNVSCILSRGPGQEQEKKASGKDVLDFEPETAREERPHFEAKGRPRVGQKTEWDGVKSFTTTVVFDEEQYDRIAEIAYQLRLSKKVALRRIIALGLKHYNRTGKF